MSASVSRRFLFTGAVGGASTLFLSACSSGASVVAAERTDYSGEVTFDSFRREGEYTAPTRTEPAKNAPVPTLPHNVDELRVLHMPTKPVIRAGICLMASTINALILTHSLLVITRYGLRLPMLGLH